MGSIVTCQDANCLDCKANYQTCILCDTGAGFYLQGVICKSQVMLGANEGINLALGIIVACQTGTTHCIDCKSNYLICTRCDTGAGFYLDGTNCKNKAMLITSQGINIASQTVSTCSSAGCINCKANHLICLECDQSQAYTLENTSCTRRCADTACLNCPNNYQICTECDQANGTGWGIHDTAMQPRK